MALGGLCSYAMAEDSGSLLGTPEEMAKKMCSSVHLGYFPEVAEHTAAYAEVIIEKSAPGTYFACNHFDGGYIGVQELGEPDKKTGKPVRAAIFSVWDAQDSGNDPHAAPEEERAKLIQRGKHVRTERFGGEGTGGKSMRLFPWKEGQVIRTLVVEKPDGEGFRQIAGYIFNPRVRKWELLSCWRLRAVCRGMGRGCAFVEDFKRDGESRKHERRATFGPVFRWNGEAWIQANEFRFTKDSNLNMSINCRLNSTRGYYSLATGGDISPEADISPDSTLLLNPLPDAKEPGKDVMRLIHAPKLRAARYKDDGELK